VFGGGLFSKYGVPASAGLAYEFQPSVENFAAPGAFAISPAEAGTSYLWWLICFSLDN
jgi:hypothetical protein